MEFYQPGYLCQETAINTYYSKQIMEKYTNLPTMTHGDDKRLETEN